jgi:hypothetical protein
MSLAQSKLSWHTSMNDRFKFRPKKSHFFYEYLFEMMLMKLKFEIKS